MSHPARAPHHWIDRQMPAVEVRHGECAFGVAGNRAACMESPQFEAFEGALGLADRVGVTTSVRPGRGRSRTKTEPDEKVKKPADGVRKKSPPARKAPARGRYVDEYARPAGQASIGPSGPAKAYFRTSRTSASKVSIPAAVCKASPLIRKVSSTRSPSVSILAA